MPAALGLVLRALGHDVVHVTESELRGRDDGYLVRHLRDVKCDWLFALDQHRQEEVWVDVYTALADEDGRLLRLRPARKRGATGSIWIAHLAKYIISSYDGWEEALADPQWRMIELGRGVIERPGRRAQFRHGFGVHQLFSRREVAMLLQQQFQMGDPRSAAPQASIPDAPAPRRNLRTRRGNRTSD